MKKWALCCNAPSLPAPVGGRAVKSEVSHAVPTCRNACKMRAPERTNEFDPFA